MNLSRRGFFTLCGGLASFPGFATRTAEARSAGTVKKAEVSVYVFICGILKTQTQNILKETRVGTPFDIPVTFFLIKHNDSWVAFDTGNNAMVAKDPIAYWSEPLVKAFTPVMRADEEFRVQIGKMGLSPGKLHAAIISHGHLDHAGAIDNFRGSSVPIYFQKKEIEKIHEALALGQKSVYIPDDFRFMDELNMVGIEGVFDLFGDGTVVAFPTPGHSIGHQSLIVRLSAGKNLVLAADAMYTLENMEKHIQPGIAWNIDQTMECLDLFKAMTYLDVKVVPSHDPGYWRDKSLAPLRFEG
jgi:N-acyl homoserine lactone hydrolase